jgi:pimeloyl-ACP methyl ester carboxylesterase
MDLVTTRHGPVACHAHGTGRPLVLLHANPGDHRDWDAVAGDLARDHRVIAVDWPGFGASPAPRTGPASASAMMFAEVAIDLADALDLRGAVAAGNSVGGYAAIRLAAERPDRVAGIIAVDSGGFTAPSWRLRAGCAIKGSEVVTRAIAGAFARRYLRRRTPAVAAILARTEAGRRDPVAVAVDAAVWRSFADPRHDLRAVSIAAPPLVVWGRHDPVVRADRDGVAAGRALGVAPIVLPTGHMPFAEDPDAFLAAVRPFLAAVGAARQSA